MKPKIISVLDQTPTYEGVRESGCVVLTFINQTIDKVEGSVSIIRPLFDPCTKLPAIRHDTCFRKFGYSDSRRQPLAVTYL